MDPSQSVPYPRYSGPHHYTTETWVGNVKDGITPEMAFGALRRWATPFSLGSKAVSTGDEVYIPGFGQTRHYVDDDHMTVVNTTVPGKHVLEPGNVHRTIIRRGDDIYVKTDGYGLGILPEANRLASHIMWPVVDQNIRHFLYGPPPGAFDPFSYDPRYDFKDRKADTMSPERGGGQPNREVRSDVTPNSLAPPPPSSPASDVPHWLTPYFPPMDWLPSPPWGADGSDTGRPAAGSSAGDWLGLQQSDFGAFKKPPQGDMGKRSDLAPDNGARFNLSAPNRLISMGLLRSPLGGNQTPVPTQVTPAAWSPEPAASSRSPSPEPEAAAHWLDGLASPPLSPSNAPPWLDPEAVGQGLRRLLGLPE